MIELTVLTCGSCGHVELLMAVGEWIGRCPSCGEETMGNLGTTTLAVEK